MRTEEGQTPEAPQEGVPAETHEAPTSDNQVDTAAAQPVSMGAVAEAGNDQGWNGVGKPRAKRGWAKVVGCMVGLLAALVVVGWWQGWHTALANRWNEASVVIKVREDEKYAVEAAKVVLNGSTYETDGAGQVIIIRAVAGSHTVEVSKEGYLTVTEEILLRRGDNGTRSISITKQPDKLHTISGQVTDHVSGLPLMDARVNVAGKSVSTDANGAFSISGVVPGEYRLSVSKVGFTTKEQSIATDDEQEGISVALVPNGRVLFVSDRADKKRALYTAAYDGSDQRQLVIPIEGTEDYAPLEAPNGKLIVYSSTRDKVPSPYSSSFLPRLYIVTADGTGLTKVSDEVSPARIEWSSNSRFLYFEAYKDTKLTQYTRRFYDTTKGTLFDLGEESQNLAMSSSGNFALYTVRVGDPNQQLLSLKIVDLTNGARRTLVENISGYLVGDGISFSPDDALVYFEAQTSEGRKRYEVTFANGQSREIQPRGDISRRFVISPNGSRKAFVEVRDGKTDMYTVAANGSDEKRVTTVGVVSSMLPISWDSSSSYLIFAIIRQGESAKYIVSANGGEIRKIVDFSLDGEQIPYYQ
jgi:Tol biopolymer transport system component